MSRADFAATFRDGSGKAVATTWAGTLCWYPRKPSKLAAVSEDGKAEHVLRCGWCPGCLELDRQRLAQRLHEHFGTMTENLWLVFIESTQNHAASMLRKVHRIIPSLKNSGFLRVSPTMLAIIVAGQKPNLRAITTSFGLPVCICRVLISRGRRAWNAATIGMLRSRDEWTPWRNRFYVRGLPKLDRSRSVIHTRAGLRNRHPGVGVGARGWRDDVCLFPPVAWLPPRLVRRRGPQEKRTNRPESIASTLDHLLTRLQAHSTQFPRHLHSPARAERASSLTEISGPSNGVPGLATGIIPPITMQGSSTRHSVRTSLSTKLSVSERLGYRGSNSNVVAEFDAWAARMAEKAKQRAKGGSDGT